MVRFRLNPCVLAVGVALITGPAAQAGQLCPNGAYVARGPCTLCPGGRYVGAGSLCSGAPLSGYTVTNERTAQLVRTSAPRSAGSGNTGSTSGTTSASGTSNTNSSASRAVTCPDSNATATTNIHCATSPTER